MILAGIDEAGLGPTLGPLVTASAALETPAGWLPGSPWQELADAVTDRFSRKEKRITVGDSKLVYAAGGMRALELAVAAFSFLITDGKGPALSFPPDDLPAKIHLCYSRSLTPFPAHVDAKTVSLAAGGLRKTLEQARAAAAHLEIAALYEPCLNRRFQSGLNKNQALLMETGRHLAALERKFPRHAIHVVIDKQGGRNDYLPLLSALFPGFWVDTLIAGASESAYRLRRDGGDIIMRFMAKADRRSFPTALASLAAKYARERSMEELNAWFGERFPEVKATAGYPVDAARWLADMRTSDGPDQCRLHSLIRER